MKKFFLPALLPFLLFAFFSGCDKDDNGVAIPVIETLNVTEITPASAKVGGSVTNDGGAAVTERGVYYGTSPAPETTGTIVNIGTGDGSFSSQLTGLEEGTEYYVTAFAINSAGTAYGQELKFVPTDILPDVTTINIIDITSQTATVRGEITDDGGNKIIERGVYIDTSQNPVVNGEKVKNGRGAGIFKSEIQGLNPETKYYVVVYAVNGVGEGYGEEKSFTTIEAEVLDSVSFTYNNVQVTYGAVKYRNRIWLDRNLGAEKTADSLDDAKSFGGLFQWGRQDDGHQERSSSIRNALTPSGFQPGHSDFIVSVNNPYDWNEDSDWLFRWTDDSGKKTEADPCPDGWRVPTREEWQSVSEGWDTREDLANSPLRLPSAGMRREYEGDLRGVGGSAYYWSSSAQSDVSFLIYADTVNVVVYDHHRASGFSIRCIKKEE